MQTSSALLLQLAVCLAAQLKGTTRQKARSLACSQQHWQLIRGASLSPPPVLFFFPPCVERKLLLCANAAVKPGLPNVLLSVATGITSPQILYLTIHGVDFAVLLSAIDQIHHSPDASCTLCVRTKKKALTKQ